MADPVLPVVYTTPSDAPMIAYAESTSAGIIIPEPTIGGIFAAMAGMPGYYPINGARLLARLGDMVLVYSLSTKMFYNRWFIMPRFGVLWSNIIGK